MLGLTLTLYTILQGQYCTIEIFTGKFENIGNLLLIGRSNDRKWSLIALNEGDGCATEQRALYLSDVLPREVGKEQAQLESVSRNNLCDAANLDSGVPHQQLLSLQYGLTKAYLFFRCEIAVIWFKELL